MQSNESSGDRTAPIEPKKHRTSARKELVLKHAYGRGLGSSTTRGRR